jgi:transcription termination/antitermination protein NusG
MEEEETTVVEEEVEEAPAAPTNPNMNWYAVGTFSSYELRAKALLEEGIASNGLEELFGEVLVPTEEVVELRGGARRTTQRRLMPGYMFIQMEMTSESWHLVKDTEKIIGFIGDDKNPKPMPKREVATLTQRDDEGTARPKAVRTFDEGSTVRVVDGPFLNFSGTVEEVNPQKQKIRVLVSIFGRATPVELDFMQVEKI